MGQFFLFRQAPGNAHPAFVKTGRAFRVADLCQKLRRFDVRAFDADAIAECAVAGEHPAGDFPGLVSAAPESARKPC